MGAQKRKPYKRKPLTAIMRPLDPSDPRSLEHPSHRERCLEFAEAIGRLLARNEWSRLEQERKA